jgi:2-succinyl-6-hydroxy-2,4-cyclohexadiene-1-carboxylate synthase
MYYPTTLFLHGFLGSKDEWSFLPAMIPKLALDLPGHGEALFEDPACYTIPNCAARIIAQLREMNLRTVYLVGYSMGGRLALYLAVHYPQFFTKVLLISASPGIEDVQEREKRVKTDWLLARNLENQDFGLFLETWYNIDLFSYLKTNPERLQEVLQKRKHNSPKHLAMSLDHMGIGQQASLWQDLPHIRLPIDIVVGSHDAKFISIGEKMSMLNSSYIKLHKIEHAGHVVHLENTFSFCKFLMIDFFS